MKTHTTTRVVIAIAVLLSVTTSLVEGAPKADLWNFWLAYNKDNSNSVSHDDWDQLLTSYIVERDRIAYFDYGNVSASDRTALNVYIKRLGATKVRSLSRDEQLAFWINLYNALTVQVILDNYPTESIRRISPRIFPPGPWGVPLITIERQPITLDDIEHRILRPIWRDERIHYAVNCASISCPNLTARAFTAQNTEELLERAAEYYINHPRAVSMDQGKLHVSSIYRWYSDDFGGNDKAVISHLMRYAAPQLRRELSTISQISHHSYDWALNDAR